MARNTLQKEHTCACHRRITLLGAILRLACLIGICYMFLDMSLKLYQDPEYRQGIFTILVSSVALWLGSSLLFTIYYERKYASLKT